jgi:hypothetical protein
MLGLDMEENIFATRRNKATDGTEETTARHVTNNLAHDARLSRSLRCNIRTEEYPTNFFPSTFSIHSSVT